jgi:hypothetical protein
MTLPLESVSHSDIQLQLDTADIEKLVDHLCANGGLPGKQITPLGLLGFIQPKGIDGNIRINEDRHGHRVHRDQIDRRT